MMVWATAVGGDGVWRGATVERDRTATAEGGLAAVVQLAGVPLPTTPVACNGRAPAKTHPQVISPINPIHRIIRLLSTPPLTARLFGMNGRFV
ncbi:MAG: hypothetical protein IPH82_19530 [Chloroflexi bacterium]|nr:hypothetical protein [Chloroflexota bacterium]